MTPHFSKAVSAAGLLFTSGQLAFGKAGAIEGEDISAQTHLALSNLENVLKEHGLSRNDIVKTTIWLSRQEDLLKYNEAYAAFFANHKPARSTVICALVVPGALVEIEAIARFTGTMQR